MADPNFRGNADRGEVANQKKLLEKTLPSPARSALIQVTRQYLSQGSGTDLRSYLEGAELSAVRTGLFVAGEIEPVKKMVMAESGSAFRVQSRSKIRDLMVFALSEDLPALRQAVGTHVEVNVAKAAGR
jgi:hypothetical protein